MQAELFQNPSSALETIDLGDGQIQLHNSVFEAAQADSLLNTLLHEIPWRQDSLWIAGREIPVPRLQCWMGDLGSAYGYSGIRLEPEPWHHCVSRIKNRVEALCARKFNSVLLNLYRNGQDSVSWHADDEPELGPDPIIASVSLGQERVFQLKHKHDKSRRLHSIELQHGSLLVMGKGIQNKWLHQLPKRKSMDCPRINLTFRNVLPAML